MAANVAKHASFKIFQSFSDPFSTIQCALLQF
jgi:hypothetical protein